jgi:hypothetical protein
MYNPLFDNSRYMNPNQNQQYQNQQYSDIQAAPTYDPQPMMGNMTETQLYPYANTSYAANSQAPYGYAEGGRVRQSRNSRTDLPSLAEMIRQQGNNEDSILAHINPLEAMMLKQFGGSGTINPKTGLPQFSFWNKPGKATRTSAGSIVGTIIGNMILPGIGGVIGGAIGQGTQHAARGKKFGEGALKGASIGAMIPSAAGLAGSGASALGMNTAGSALSNYGAQNSILASLGMNGMGGMGASGGMGGGVAAGGAPMKEYYLNQLANNVALPGGAQSAASAGSGAAPGFMSQLGTNSSSFFSKPQNLLALASAAGSFAGREKPRKEKTPEQLANEQKRYEQALILTAQERAAKEANSLANRQMERRIEMNKFLPEERFAVNPMYRRAHNPNEYRNTGNWLSYHDNPQFTGQPILMKSGGRAQRPEIEIEEFEIEYPSKEGYLLHGYTGGQDDKIKALLSDGEYVIPADVVSHIGDGNNMSGGKKLDHFLKNVRKHKGAGPKLPPKLKSLANYMTR